MNQKGMSRWFQIALWGSSTKAQNDATVDQARISPRRSRTKNATSTATHARQMIQRSPAAPPAELNHPSVEKISRRFETGTFV